jgi:mRNA deadenylase 3'-5' endonuclease subunit Ccr4
VVGGIMVKKFPNRTPLSAMAADLCRNGNSSSDQHLLLSVASFNLLAPCYVRPLDRRTGRIQPFAAFEWVSDDSILEWELAAGGRKDRVLNMLQACHADVLCLQELQLERQDQKQVVPDWIRPLLSLGGYKICLPPDEELEHMAERNLRVLGIDAAVTNAVLYKTDRWVLTGEASENTTTSVAVCLTPKTKTTTFGDTGSTTTATSAVVVASVHLDATDERKRVAQCSTLLKKARVLVDDLRADDNKKKNKYPLSVIFAGDMNQEFLPGSCVTSFLRTDTSISAHNQQQAVTDEQLREACASSLRVKNSVGGDGPSDQQLQEWKELRAEAYRAAYDSCVSLSRIETGPTRAAYDHAEEEEEETDNDAANQEILASTSVNINQQQPPKTMGTWHLDHILYSAATMQPLGIWSTLEDDPESCATGLPNNRCPTDHLPVAALFQVRPAMRLEGAERQALIDTLNSLTTRQKQELQTLEAEFDRQLEDIESKLPKQEGNENPANGGNNKNKKKNKKKKQKKGPPPKEVMDFMRQRRARVKQVKAEHRTQRQELVDGLLDKERLAMQEEFRITASAWVDHG